MCFLISKKQGVRFQGLSEFIEETSRAFSHRSRKVFDPRIACTPPENETGTFLVFKNATRLSCRDIYRHLLHSKCWHKTLQDPQTRMKYAGPERCDRRGHTLVVGTRSQWKDRVKGLRMHALHWPIEHLHCVPCCSEECDLARDVSRPHPHPFLALIRK